MPWIRAFALPGGASASCSSTASAARRSRCATSRRASPAPATPCTCRSSPAIAAAPTSSGDRLGGLVRDRGGRAPTAWRSTATRSWCAACRWVRSWPFTTRPAIRARCPPWRFTRPRCGWMAGASPGTAAFQARHPEVVRGPLQVRGAGSLGRQGSAPAGPGRAGHQERRQLARPASPRCPAA